MGWLVFVIALAVGGFVIGGLARFALPGPDPMPWWATILLGLGGSFVGGIISSILIGRVGSFFFAFLGAVLLLILYRRVVQHRGVTDRTPPGRLPPRV